MTPAVAAPTFEHHREALGIGAAAPRLSWKTTAGAGWTQAAYELRVQRGDQVWESGTPVASDESVLVPWPVAPLASRERAEVSVRVTGADGSRSAWSEPAAVEAGLLAAVRLDRPSPWARPGRRTPSPTSAGRRCCAGSSRARGDRRRGAALRDRARPLRGRDQRRAASATTRSRPAGRVYRTPPALLHLRRDRAARRRARTPSARGSATAGTAAAWASTAASATFTAHDLALLAQLEMTLRRRHRSRRSRPTTRWRAAPGPIVRSGIYDGELYDAREEPPGGRRPASTTPTGTGVRRRSTAIPRRSSRPRGRRCAAPRRSRRSRCITDAERTPRARLRPEPRRPRCASACRGHRRADGHAPHTPRCCRTASSAPARCATREVHRRRTRCAGGDVEEWEPRFTFHGFRYAEVDGLARRPRRRRGDRRPAVVYHTDMRAHRLVRRAPTRLVEPAARERRVEHARQLPRHPDRLPAARRAPRLDRRHPGVRADRLLPLRLRRHARVVAARPRGRAAAGRHRALVRARDPGAPHVDADPRRAPPGATPPIVHPVGALRALRRRGHPRRAVRQRARRGSTLVERLAGPTGSGTGLPARRLARPGRAAGGPGRRDDRPRTSSPRPTSPARPTASRAWPRCSGRRDDAERYRRARRRGARGVRAASTCCPTAA